MNPMTCLLLGAQAGIFAFSLVPGFGQTPAPALAADWRVIRPNAAIAAASPGVYLTPTGLPGQATTLGVRTVLASGIRTKDQGVATTRITVATTVAGEGYIPCLNNMGSACCTDYRVRGVDPSTPASRPSPF